VSYNVIFARMAEENFARIRNIDPQLASYVLDRIDELKEHPTELSQRGHFPFLEDQRFAFWGQGVHANIWFNVFFVYSQDESTIEITAIGFVEY
jgi:hypothetical protein